MARYRTGLPQMQSNQLFLTDSGLETCMIFKEGFNLPHFAAFPLVGDENGRKALMKYYRQHLDAAAKGFGLGFILETPTWRASRKWARKLGISEEKLEQLTLDTVEMLCELRRNTEEELEDDAPEIVVSGVIGPWGDGYIVSDKMTVCEARDYHSQQIETFAAKTKVDMVSAATLSYFEEAVGIVEAAKSFQIPVVIGFTVETDGLLPSGQTLKDAIQTVDKETKGGPEYYMINCAHPLHFEQAFEPNASWQKRIRAVRPNSSEKSHKELDDADELDAGDPEQLGLQIAQLRKKTSLELNVIGGCCGTDLGHVRQMAIACLSLGSNI